MYLYNRAGQVVDVVEYGFQLKDVSIGRGPGGTWDLLAGATAGGANSGAAAQGSVGKLRLNEWLGGGVDGEDWFEVYNGDGLPVSLSGMYVTDDPSVGGQTNYGVGPLSYVGAGGWVRWWADGQSERGGTM